jgi:hypothetical protein
MSGDSSQLARSRDRWRKLAFRLEAEQGALRAPGDPIDIVEDEAGDLLMVTYGVHDYPIAIGVLRSKSPKFRENAIKVEGDVRTARRVRHPK